MEAFYSDREGITRPRESKIIPEATWGGIVALIQTAIDQNWLASEFPDRCPDGNGIVGTNRGNLIGTVEALIPGLEWPLSPRSVPLTDVALDLVNFIAQRVSQPADGPYHDFFKHYELRFDAAAGRRAFRDQVNQLFARGGMAFEVNELSRVIRMGPPELRQVLSDLQPSSGDQTLDELILEARRRFLSRDPADERIGLEKLWDAFERLKTLEPGRDKKAQVSTLLDRVATGPLRQAIDDEAVALTALGNGLQIRHFETTKVAVSDDEVDYLFGRMATLVLYLLRRTGRLKI